VTKTGEQAKLNVLASVDLKLIHLRKADDRNRNDVTIVAALFDANGNFIAGQQKILQLRLLDDTVQALERRPPVTIDTNFDVHPAHTWSGWWRAMPKAKSLRRRMQAYKFSKLVVGR